MGRGFPEQGTTSNRTMQLRRLRPEGLLASAIRASSPLERIVLRKSVLDPAGANTIILGESMLNQLVFQVSEAYPQKLSRIIVISGLSSQIGRSWRRLHIRLTLRLSDPELHRQTDNEWRILFDLN